ncbi:hypothetical protein [Vibrio superstes]|uniref:Uncharacterized protein n=1 Tax=Vibrio superstes NBRC 103154 TaxID=1219062 RepID=A0A511QTJ1_9VIBR|nr:hypothetical protein [Vibrio superstes]GEM80660.1 hypothetical protein VSU01S_29050 [Vibrio superstes NBRC 103154]
MYSKQSKEYRSNGIYYIEGQLFYSIWAFKTQFPTRTKNNEQMNIQDTSELEKVTRNESCIPDFGNLQLVKIFPLLALQAFYA